MCEKKWCYHHWCISRMNLLLPRTAIVCSLRVRWINVFCVVCRVFQFETISTLHHYTKNNMYNSNIKWTNLSTIFSRRRRCLLFGIFTVIRNWFGHFFDLNIFQQCKYFVYCDEKQNKPTYQHIFRHFDLSFRSRHVWVFYHIHHPIESCQAHLY